MAVVVVTMPSEDGTGYDRPCGQIDVAAPYTSPSQRLETAYTRDLPVTFTVYQEPQLLGRRPIHYSEVLSYLHAQHHALHTQQQRSGGPSSSVVSLLPPALQEALAVAVGAKESYPVDTSFDDEEQLTTNTDNTKEEEEKNRGGAHTNSNGSAAIAPSDETEKGHRAECRNEVLQYLFSSSSNDHGDDDDDESKNSRRDKSERATSSPDDTVFFGMRQIPPDGAEYVEVLHRWLQLPLGAEKATNNDGNGVAGATATAGGGVPPSSLPHRALREALEALRVRTLPVPPALRSAARGVSSGGVPSSSSSPDEVDAADHLPLYTYAPQPAVLQTVPAVVDAVIPPRLLMYFDVDRGAAAAEYARRLRHQQRLNELRRELCSSSSTAGGGQNGAAATTTTTLTAGQRLVLENDYQSELAQRDALDPVVGEALCLVERASTAPSSRADLLLLERTLEEELDRARARCRGAPFHTNPKSSNYEAQQRGLESKLAGQMTTTVSEAMNTTYPPVGGGMRSYNGTVSGRVHRPAPPPQSSSTAPGQRGKTLTKARAQKGAAGATHKLTDPGTAAPTTGTLFSIRADGTTTGDGDEEGDGYTSAAAAAVTTTVSSAQPFFCSTVKYGATPTSLDEVAGGTATVLPTLNVVELNKERHVIQFDLLGQELLRQVAMDLPERGVFLARLMNEARLSMEAYAVLLSERTQSSAEHLALDGAEVRAAQRARVTELEGEVAALRQRQQTLLVRREALENWAAESHDVDADLAAERKAFEEAVLDRLRQHTEVIRAAQDRERKGSLVE